MLNFFNKITIRSLIISLFLFVGLYGLLYFFNIELGLGGVSTKQRINIVSSVLFGLLFLCIFSLIKGKALTFNFFFLLFILVFVEGIIIEKGNGIGIRKKQVVARTNSNSIKEKELTSKEKKTFSTNLANTLEKSKSAKLTANLQSSVSDNLLGYNLKPGTYLVKKNCYEVIYNHTKDSIRMNPINNQTDDLALLFGCSFTYGTGLNDEHTLGANLAILDSSRNYLTIAQEGYGIQQMLVNLDIKSETNTFLKEAIERADLGIYFYLQDHIYRLLGKNHLVTYHWGTDFPYYHINETNNAVKLAGKLGDQLSFAQKALYFPVHISLLYKKIYFNFFYKGAEEIEGIDYEKTALAIKHAKDRFLKESPQKQFLVVLFPFTDNTILSYLQKHQIEVLDCTKLVDKDKYLEYTLCNEDPHPNAKLNALVSQNIIAHLAKSK